MWKDCSKIDNVEVYPKDCSVPFSIICINASPSITSDKIMNVTIVG